MTEFKDIPTINHYAALVSNTRNIYHAGDERSKTNPGHGYPAYTETIKSIEYISFENISKMKEWVKFNKDKTFRLIRVQPMVMNEEISFSYLDSDE